MALDAMTTFAFGNGIEHNATKPTLDLLKGIQQDRNTWDVKEKNAESLDEPLTFPEGKLSEVLEAIQTLCGTVMELHGAPIPALQWAITNRKPRVRRSYKVKNEYIRKQIQGAIERQERGVVLKAAVDQMVLREKSLAEKEGRSSQFFSGVMFDEVSGHQEVRRAKVSSLTHPA